MYEQKKQPLLSLQRFYRRVARHLMLGLFITVVSLAIGVLGYHWLAELSWVDSFLNASMILGGMGPVDPLHSASAKIFAAFYALYSGLVLIGTASLLLAPFLHRLMHQFHLEDA